MSKTVVKSLLLVVLAWTSIQTTQAQKVVCPNFHAGHDSLNKLITKHLPVDSAKTLYFQFGWAANNLRLYSNVIVDFEDIMPYAFYKEVEKGFVYVSTEKLQYFYMQYEYGSGKSTCWIRNSALENPPERKPKPLIKVEAKKDSVLSPLLNPEINPELKNALKELQKRGERSGKESGEGFRTGSPGNGSGTGSPDGGGSTYKPKQQIEVIEEIEMDDDVDFIAPPPQEISEREEIFEIYSVQEKPEYRGGQDELMKFLADNIRYPTMAKEAEITGTVIVQFAVDKYGGVSDVRTLGNKKGYGLEEEAMRVIILTSGRWTPAKQRDKPVSMRMQLPVKFALN